MPRFIGWILTPLFGVLAVAIAQSVLHTWRVEQVAGMTSSMPAWGWLACPAAFGLRAIWALTCRHLGRDNPWSFIDTLEHELTHALFGYLTFNPPVSLRASLDGDGEVELKGQNPLTLLSPYFFPLFLSLTVLLSLGMAQGYRLGFTVLSLFLMGNFLFRLLAEFRWRQTDLHAYGFLFSTALSAAALMGVLGTILSLLQVISWQWASEVPAQAWQGLTWMGIHSLALITWATRQFNLTR